MAILFLLALEFKVGVVNLKECFHKDKYDRIQEIDATLQKAFQEYTNTLLEIRKKMEVLETKLQGLTKDMQIYWDYLGQLKQAETEFEFQKKAGRLRYMNRYNELQIHVYNEIRRVVSMYAKDKGFDLILRVEAPQLEADDESVQGAAAQIQARAVLYHAEGIDITGDILRILNLEYAKEKAAAPKK